MGATLTSALALYREHYHENIAEIFFSSKKLTSPILASLESKSMDDGFGRGYVVPTVHRLPGNVRPTFAASQTAARLTSNRSTFGATRWVVQAVECWATANFDGPSVRGAKGDSDKLLDVVKLSMETSTASVRKRLAHYVSGAGWGKVATILSLSTTTIGIDPALCNRLQEDDDVAGAATESASAFRAITSGDQTTISAINRTTGVLTVGTDPTAGTPMVVGDTLFHFNDREDSASPSRLVICGLDGWFGTASASFHSVDQTASASLAAHQIDGAGKDYAQASVEALRTLFSYDSYASAQYVAPIDYETISLDKDAVKVVEMEVGKYKLGFEGLMASWSGYSVAILPDAMVDPNKSYVGPFDDSDCAPFLAHNGDLVNVADEDGNEVRAADATDRFEARLYFRGNVICPGPGKFARITNFGL